jgi:hypothetical protein
VQDDAAAGTQISGLSYPNAASSPEIRIGRSVPAARRSKMTTRDQGRE